MSAGANRRPNGDGSVYFDRHRNRWIAQVTDLHGRRHKRSASTQRKAESLLRDLLTERDRLNGITSPKATFGDLMVKWRDTRLAAEQIAPATRKSKMWAYERAHRELASVTLTRLTTDRIEHALGRMADDGLSRESLIKVRSLIQQVCRFGERRSLLSRNPAAAVELPSGLAISDDGRALTPEQARLLLDSASGDRLYALWCAMTMLGLRPGEALGLHWDQIDLEAERLDVRRTLRQGADGLEIVDELKTVRSRRSLEMPELLTAGLRQRRTRQDEDRQRAGAAWSTHWDGLVFTTQIGTPISPANLRREFRQLTNRCGLGDWSPNELRHTAVSLLSHQGVPLERIADVVGHSGTRMTAKVYRHVVTASVAHAVDPMNELFNGLEPSESGSAS